LKAKRRRSNNSSDDTNDSIYSFYDQIREKNEELEHKESQILKYELDLDKLKAENKDLLVIGSYFSKI
jgi:DNA polymerase sigma